MKDPTIEDFDRELRLALNYVLGLCEAQQMPQFNINLDDDLVQVSYLVVLTSNHIDAETLRAAAPSILALEYFPKAGKMALECIPHRDRLGKAPPPLEYRDPLHGHVMALARDGVLRPVRADRVRDGLELGPGDDLRTANGEPYVEKARDNPYEPVPLAPAAPSLPAREWTAFENVENRYEILAHENAMRRERGR